MKVRKHRGSVFRRQVGSFYSGTETFPELKERCRKKHVHLIDVDLRWGMIERDTKDGKALDIKCFYELALLMTQFENERRLVRGVNNKG